MECGNYSRHDYDTMTKYQADRLVSLLTYLHYENGPPQWCTSFIFLSLCYALATRNPRVRATYVTLTNNFALDPAFLSSIAPLTSAQMRDCLVARRAPLFHVTPDTFIPSLRDGDVEKVDSLLLMKGKRRTCVPAEVRNLVVGGKQAPPKVASMVFKQKNARQCAFCEEVMEKELMVCSRYVNALTLRKRY